MFQHSTATFTAGTLILAAGLSAGAAAASAPMGVIGAINIEMIRAAWGSSERSCDLNGDGVVSSSDLAIVLGSPGGVVYPDFIDRLHPVVEVSPDFNGDAAVDEYDRALLFGAWGTSNPRFDLNQDGIVNAGDLAELLGAFDSAE